MEELTQFEFDEEFEQKLLAFFVRDLEFFNENSQHMKSNYFVSKIRGDIYHLSSEYVKKYGKLIPPEDLKNEITNMYLSLKKKDIPIDMYWDVLADLYARDVSVGQQYARDQVVAFAKGQEMANVLKDGAKRIQGGKDLNPILTGVTKALAIGKKTPKIRTCGDVDETIGGEADDWIVRGLIAKKDVNLWYAPPGCGKSHLIWLIGNAVNDGKECLDIEVRQTPVTYIDLENTEDVRRHFKRLLGSGKMGLITLEDEDVAIPNIDSAPEKFEEFILTLPQGVVVIDTFPMITGETKFAESKWEVDPMVKTLRRLCAKGYTFVLIFHSLKADPKTIKGPQELLGRCGHVVSIYSVPDVGATEETEELDTSDPNKPKTLFVGTGPNLKSRHKKYRYWLRADLNEGQPWVDEIVGYKGYSGYPGGGFKRISNPSDPVLEKIQAGLVDYLKNKDTTEDLDDYYPNQGEFVELITNLLGCSDKQARKYVKLGVGKYWGEKPHIGPKGNRYYPKPQN
jgi:hypothetical protein